MNICVSDELIDLKAQLGARGYNIVSSDEYYDAMICNLKETDLSQISGGNSIKNHEVLIIDSGSKTVYDIENILLNRSYTSLY